MSTINKALGLLEHFSSNAPEIGLAEFRALSGFDKGTVHRYLSNLRTAGFLEQNPTTRAYRLGPALIRLAAVREQTVPLLNVVAPHIDRFADDIGELVHAALPQPGGMSSLCAKDGGLSGTRVGFDDAEVLPFHATSSGIAMLAFGDPATANLGDTSALHAFTQHTAVSASDLDALINKARSLGYAFADQSFETDVRSVAVPFFGAGEAAIGTLAIATPSARMTAEHQRNFVAGLSDLSVTITQDLAGTVPPTLLQKWAAL